MIKGGREVWKPQNLADIICGHPLKVLHKYCRGQELRCNFLETGSVANKEDTWPKKHKTHTFKFWLRMTKRRTSMMVIAYYGNPFFSFGSRKICRMPVTRVSRKESARPEKHHIQEIRDVLLYIFYTCFYIFWEIKLQPLFVCLLCELL